MSDKHIESVNLLEEVISLIEEGDWALAEEMSKKLQAQGSTDGWHLLSVVLAHQDREEEAFAVLDEGINRFPESWGLILEKANLMQQLERYEEADELLESVKGRFAGQDGEVEMMRARGEFLQGKVDEALNRLQTLANDSPEDQLEAISLQMEFLEAVGRTDLILELSEDFEENLPAPTNEEEFEVIADILARVANAHWEESDDTDTARKYLRLAFHYFRNHQDSLWLWREMQPVFADAPIAFTVKMSGKFLEQEDLGDFSGKKYTTDYGVVAANMDDVMRLIHEFEIEAVDKASLKIVEVTEEDAESEEAVGIYWAGDMMVLDELDLSPNGLSPN